MLKNDLVVVLGNLPPPMGGAAKNTKLIADELSQKVNTVVINTSVGRFAHNRSFTYHFNRIAKTIKSIALLGKNRKYNKKVLYIVPDGGLGMIYTLSYLLASKVFKYKIILHHRTFKYIDDFSRLMWLSRKLLGGSETHVFLSKGMENKYLSLYGNLPSVHISDNAKYVVPLDKVINHKNYFTIGYLSNLCEEKGFDEVIQLFESLAPSHQYIRLKIAGKPVGDENKDKLDLILKRWSERVEYVGFVDGALKDQFYSTIDVFVFPTKFKQEAQPNVIYEAMAKSCTCIAWGRACIPEMYSENSGLIIPVENDFIAPAKKIISQFVNNKELLMEYRSNSLQEIKQKNAKATSEFNTFINSMVYQNDH
jgi:glycosyltransferase involved in cell wall biosynthesis